MLHSLVGSVFALFLHTPHLPMVAPTYVWWSSCSPFFACAKKLSVGGGVWPTDQLLSLKKVTENAVANSLAAWLTLTNFFANLRIFGGLMPPHPPSPGKFPLKCGSWFYALLDSFLGLFVDINQSNVRFYSLLLPRGQYVFCDFYSPPL